MDSWTVERQQVGLGVYSSQRLCSISVTTYRESKQPPPAGVEAAVP